MGFPVFLSDHVPKVHVYSLESSIAERFEAIVSLADALKETFENRHRPNNGYPCHSVQGHGFILPCRSFVGDNEYTHAKPLKNGCNRLTLQDKCRKIKADGSIVIKGGLPWLLHLTRIALIRI